MNLTEEQYEQIRNAGNLNYAPLRVAVYLGVDKRLFMRSWNNVNSRIRKEWEGGKLESEVSVGIGILDSANSGNITAAQTHLKESKARDFERIKQEVFFDSEIQLDEEQ